MAARTRKSAVKAKSQSKYLNFKKAVDLLRQHDRRLVLMHTAGGDHYYVVPGGIVTHEHAQRILQRGDIQQLDPGLFPNNPQSWRLAR
jgi:hypothetical protein